MYSVSNLSNIETEQTDNVDLTNNMFYSEADFGIYSKTSNNSDLSGNKYNDDSRFSPVFHTGRGNTKTGLWAKNCNNLNIGAGSSFWCCDKGIEWYADAVYAVSTIFESNFSGCNNGVMFAQQVNPRTNTNLSLNTDTTNQRQLKIICNLFESDSMAIVGSGKLINQGFAGSGGIKNKFVYNINWDLAPQNHFNYYYRTPGNYNPNIGLGLLKSRVRLNTILNIGYGGGNGGSGLTCPNSLLVHKETPWEPKPDVPFNASLYPNPTNNVLFIIFNEKPKEKISVNLYNSIGQMLLSKEISEKEYMIDMQHYAAGMYYIKMNSSAFKGNYKVVKQ